MRRLCQIQPLLANVATSVLRSSIGVFRWYAGRIREGYRPHPRHFQVLAKLVGIGECSELVDLPSRPPGKTGASWFERDSQLFLEFVSLPCVEQSHVVDAAFQTLDIIIKVNRRNFATCQVVNSGPDPLIRLMYCF